MSYEELWRPLAEVYGAGEAKAIARMVLDVCFGLSLSDILCGKVTNLSADDQQKLQKIRTRLLAGEPVQYVLGVAEFGGRQFKVGPGVLIPRPETYELCQWVLDDGCWVLDDGCWMMGDGCNILDIGTGSGCIACTLAAALPQASVTGWDISADALAIAEENAKRASVHVSFEQVDILHPSSNTHHLSPLTHHPSPFTHIVSNPPYICESEAAEMEPHVLHHEPYLALFVPNDDPLLFYRSIADFALTALKQKGRLYFEINPPYADLLRDMLLSKGFQQVSSKEDQFGKLRFIQATRP